MSNSADEQLLGRLVDQALTFHTTGFSGFSYWRRGYDPELTPLEGRLFQLYAALGMLVRDIWLYLQAHRRDDAALFEQIITPIIEVDQERHPGTTMFQPSEALAEQDRAAAEVFLEGFMAAATMGQPTINGLDDGRIVHEWTTKPGKQFLSGFARQCGEVLTQVLHQPNLDDRERAMRVARVYQQQCFSDDPAWYPLLAILSSCEIKRSRILAEMALPSAMVIGTEAGELPRRSAVRSYVHTGFADDQDDAHTLDSTMPLACEQEYLFWLEVSNEPQIPGSIEEHPIPLRTEGLPPKARIKVVLFAFPDGIRIEPGADVGELELQPEGSARVTRQPGDRVPIAGIGEQRLFFPIRAPARAAPAQLRCCIYYEQTLLQSLLIRAQVTETPQNQASPALRSTVDYTLIKSLQPARLTAVPPHRLSIMLNTSDDGTHQFRFFGSQEFKSNADLEGQQLQDLITKARGALCKVAWGSEVPWDSEKHHYRYAGSCDQDQLRDDLITLAVRGYRIYDTIINNLAGGFEPAESLAELMRTPGLVQIALKAAASHIIPMALCYDYHLDTNLPKEHYTLCPGFLDALQSPAPLEQAPCFNGDCPSRGSVTTICPSGFWGFRHALGMPVSIETAPDTPAAIAWHDQLDLIVGVSTDPEFIDREAHIAEITRTRPKLAFQIGHDRHETLDLLKESDPELVYFFCHGGVLNNQPYIQVGSTSEIGITRDNLRAYGIRWKQSRPLVFINGCHTTALEPEVAIDLVSGFIENAYASGVIGTEITCFESLARAFAESFIDQFIDGVPVGEALRRARLTLLKAGNPLGLIYVPFVMAGLKLVEQA